MAENVATVRCERDKAIATLTLDNAARHNALGQAELDALSVQLDKLAADDSLRVLVLRGAGEKTFCAGAALDQLDGVNFDGDSFARVTQRLAELAIPTVCALNGNVFGAGVDLALACDFRIGLEGTRMRVPAAAIGACYPPASVQRIVAQLGVAAARRLLLAAEIFDDQLMLEHGF
ncbi:MAG: enoyl-CoA hydratase/isomerase family protein, partial [Pseudomonadales bacterium]